jgi:hypothetical protein
VSARRVGAGAEGERGLAIMGHWKADDKLYGGVCTDIAQVRVLMRDVKWFESFVGCKDKNIDEWKELNRQLLQGYAHHTEPDFEGKKAMGHGNGNKGVYDKLCSVAHARCSEAQRDVALSGLPETRNAFYLDGWDEKRKVWLEAKMTQNSAAKKAKTVPAATAAAKRPRADDEEEEEGEEEARTPSRS